MGKPQITEQLEKTSYEKLVVSGEGLFQVSGECILKKITIGQGVSGESFSIFDAASGLVLSNDGVLIGRNFCNQLGNPVTLEYDIKCASGLALIVSGSWYLTATYVR